MKLEWPFPYREGDWLPGGVLECSKPLRSATPATVRYHLNVELAGNAAFKLWMEYELDDATLNAHLMARHLSLTGAGAAFKRGVLTVSPVNAGKSTSAALDATVFGTYIESQ